MALVFVSLVALLPGVARARRSCLLLWPVIASTISPSSTTPRWARWWRYDIPDPNFIFVGQRLRLPNGASAGSTTTPVATPTQEPVATPGPDSQAECQAIVHVVQAGQTERYCHALWHEHG